MENFTAAGPVTVSPCCPSWRRAMTTHNNPRSWNRLGALDLQASSQNGGEDGHLPVTERQRKHMPCSLNLVGRWCYWGQSSPRPANFRKAPEPYCETAENSVYCWQCCHCGRCCTHTPSHYPSQQPLPSVLCPLYRWESDTQRSVSLS